MPFIIVFNIIICVVFGSVLLTLVGCSVATKDNKKRVAEKQAHIQEKIDKVRGVAYIVFLCAMVLMIITNILF